MKILASDFDKTLLFGNNDKFYYNLDDIKAIRLFQSEGNLFGICSGRSYSGITNFNYHNIDYDFYIVCSGAKILNNKGEIIFQKFIKKDLAKQIYQYLKDVDTSIVYNNKMYVLNRINPSSRVKLINSMDEIGEEFEAMSFHLDNEKTASSYYLYLKKLFNNKIEIFQNENHLDLVAKGCSKGNAILKIIDYYKINKEEMAVIGDSYNDLPMLQVVNNAFTFNRSPKEVRDNANYLVDYVYECIDILRGNNEKR